MMNRSDWARRIGLGLTAALALTMALPGIGADKPQQEKVSPKLTPALKAAQEAATKEQWDQVLAKATEADATPDKSEYDQFVINEFKISALMHMKRVADAAPAYEQNLNSAHLPAAEAGARLKNMVRIYASLQNWPKATEYGERWLKTGENDPELTFVVGQSYFAQQDYKGAAPVLENAIKQAQQGGKKPDENWLQMLQNCYAKLANSAKDPQEQARYTAEAGRTTEQLVTNYPKPEYWGMVLGPKLRAKNSDRVQLNLYRLAREVGALQNAGDYVDMTEMLIAAGLPGEAASVLQAGIQTKALDTSDPAQASRYKKRLEEARAAADRDQASLPSQEKEIQKAPTGQGEVALGMGYQSFGQYDKAAAALAKGLQLGGVKDPDQAQLMLGIASLKSGKSAEAVKAFESVKDPQLAEVARLWMLVAKNGSGNA